MDSNIASARDWKAACVSSKSTLQHAIENLDQTAWQICLVTDQEGRLEGTITDGDVRRGLLRGLGLGESVLSVVEKKFLVVTDDIDIDSVFQLMRVNSISQIPTVSSDGKVTGLYLLSDFIKTPSTSQLMVVMAGGKGTRLYPHTKQCPKPMVEVNGKPMLEHIISKARDHGCQEFVIAVHHLGDVIKDYFGDGSNFGVSINYISEQFPLGTAGALSLLKPIPAKPFLVTNGDVITEINYSELVDFHNRNKSLLTIAVRKYEWQQPFGVVHTEGSRVVGFEEKPTLSNYINAGIYVVSPETLSELTENEAIDMPEFMARISDEGGSVNAYPMHEAWVDVGRPDDLERARQNIV